MENNVKDGSGGAPPPAKSNNENPNSTATEPEPESNLSRQSSRTPFTNLTQVDADLALARTLQEQERAYMMLRMNAEGNGYGSSDSGSFVHEDDDDDDDLDEMNGDDDEDDDEDSDVDEDVFDVHAREEEEQDEDDELENNETVELDPSAFSSDEAYARALQDAEDRELVGRLMSLSGVNDAIFVGDEEDSEDNDHDHDSNSQDTWEDIDPDELSYEELIALGEVVGTESRGLSSSMIASLPTVNYKMPSDQDGSTDQCVICRLDYEDGETLTVLSCKHLYHPECINNWLKINKVCPVCSSEVSTSGNR